jgi:ribosomal protein S3AE
MAERKRYIEVESPFLGESIRVLGTPEELNNKTIKLDLTRKLRGKGLTIKLRIFNIEGKLYALPNSMTLATSYIRRMMRKNTNYVEDSFQTRCADIRVTFKPHLVTRKKVSRAVRRNLRNTAREFITEYCKDKTFIQIAEEIYNETLQKTILPKLKKVYPLSFCDIRVFETKDLAKIDLNAAIQTKNEELEQEDIEQIEEPTEEETEEETTEENIKEQESTEDKKETKEDDN